MTFVDPGAQELITRLAKRVAALERQMEAIAGRLDPGAAVPSAAPDPGRSPGADEVLALLRQGKEIHAIKAHRSWTGASLGDAQREIARLKAKHGL